MKLILFILFSMSLNLLAQDSPRFVAEISGSVSSHVNLEARFGTQFATMQNGEINTSLAYQFSISGFHFNNLSKLNSSTGIMANFLGGSFSYFFLKKERIVRPFFEINMLIKVGSNFSKDFPSSGGFITLSEQLRSDYFGDYLYSHRYSTPFIARFSAGCNFRINSKLHLFVAAGYELRTTKEKRRKEYLDYQIYEL